MGERPLCEQDVRLSKSLSWLLRHNLDKVFPHLTGEEVAEAKSSGYVSIEAVLKLEKFKGRTLTDIQKVCQLDSKQRFSIRPSPGSLSASVTGSHSRGQEQPSCYQIRANQGHSIEGIDPGLKKLRRGDPELRSLDVIHGTFWENLDKIFQSGGLNRISRNHIHFSKGLPGDAGVISGMRKSCQICIYVDIEAAMTAGFEFYESANGVILCQGNASGTLPTEFFSKVVDRKSGKIINIPRT